MNFSINPMTGANPLNKPGGTTMGMGLPLVWQANRMATSNVCGGPAMI